MKKHLSKIVMAGFAIALIICFWTIGQLKREIQEMENRFSYSISNMESSLSSNSSYFQELYEKEASILTKAEWSYGSMDSLTYLLDIRCNIVPKMYDPQVTKATLFYEDQSIPMELVNGEFVADVPVYIFKDEINIDKVQFEENGVIRSESLDWQLYPMNECVPFVYTYYYGNAHGSAKNQVYIKTMDGSIDVSLETTGLSKNTISLKEAYLVTYLNENETSRKNITPNSLEQQNESFLFQYNLKHSFEIPFDSTYQIYVEVIDENGLTYLAEVQNLFVDETGECYDYTNNYKRIIKDRNGKVLYKGEW